MKRAEFISERQRQGLDMLHPPYKWLTILTTSYRWINTMFASMQMANILKSRRYCENTSSSKVFMNALFPQHRTASFPARLLHLIADPIYLFLMVRLIKLDENFRLFNPFLQTKMGCSTTVTAKMTTEMYGKVDEKSLPLAGGQQCCRSRFSLRLDVLL